MPYTRTLFAAALLLAFESSAGAWGNLGHRAVARIAQERLTPQTAKRLADLFDGTNALERVASCADAILHERGTTDCGGLIRLPPDERRATARWHYMNIPISRRVGAGDVARYCPEKTDCVWGQIPRQVEVVRTSPSAEKRRVALMYLVHLVGDLHQPLHVGDDSDRGGTDDTVGFPGGSKSLHSLWDGLITIREWQSGRALEFEPLMALLREDLGGRDTASWLKGDTTTEAVLEGHALARDVVYPAHRAGRGKVDAKYQDQHQPVAFERLERAGVRLAALIELALSGPPPSKTLDPGTVRLTIERAAASRLP